MAAERTIADILREAREATGLSLRGAARDMGVDASYLSRIESGERALTEQIREQAERVYEVDGDLLALSAGTVPADVLKILQDHPELLAELRARHEQPG